MIAILLIGCVFATGCSDEGPVAPTFGTIQGRVSTAVGDTSIAGALVSSSPPTSAVLTDDSGGFSIPNVPEGQYTISASKGQYNSASVSITVIAGKTTPANMLLTVGNRNPEPPNLLAPANGSSGEPTSTQLIWSASDPDGDELTYDVYFQAVGQPTSVVSVEQLDTSYTVMHLDTATTYSWRIVAKDPDGASATSVTATFTTRHDIIPTDGLIAFYPFNSNALDASGNGHDGTVHGAMLTSDRFGESNRAYVFNNSYITVPHSPDLSFDPAASLSIELWLYRTADVPMHILGKRITCWSAGGGNYQAAIAADNLLYEVAEIPLNVWVHVCATFSGTTINVYIDGEFRGTHVATRDPENTVDLKIGNSSDCPSYWIGKLDDVRIYNRVLTTDEIRSLYHVGGW
jgi:hypothetical protein